jgi:hypothetical protein
MYGVMFGYVTRFHACQVLVFIADQPGRLPRQTGAKMLFDSIKGPIIL